ncbi:hypothetical protein GCM10025883_30150 [Mobilicoccus caccae]|uniref:Uncharacterized protein n=1 Tax=Mobilicoccus caccae TaxID=1859295 RepID=A0ABQ6ISS7_9MICO|nr:hypothetical protein GCM10025883_30150 [Mobilicoccus caccae]
MDHPHAALAEDAVQPVGADARDLRTGRVDGLCGHGTSSRARPPGRPPGQDVPAGPRSAPTVETAGERILKDI